MKIKVFFSAIILLMTFFTSCSEPSKENTVSPPFVEHSTMQKTNVTIKDYGAEPVVLDIESYTKINNDFRVTLWTGKNLQVTLMVIPVGGEVGLELHSDIDQFLRIEEGKAKVMMGDSKDSLDFVQEAGEDFAIFVPAGKWHNIINDGNKPLKLYSIYAPAEHPHGTIHQTYQEAMEAEHHHH